MTHQQLSKNHQGCLTEDKTHEPVVKMYETDDDNDGFSLMLTFLSKINDNCSAFFQYPAINFSSSKTTWFLKCPLGINKLNSIMKEISKAANLSKLYTNYCVQATTITVLSNGSVVNRHIMAISGHRSETSLQLYNSRPLQS